MAATIGGANQIGSGTPSASSIASSTWPASNACDGNINTYWNADSSLPQWWAYDFGSPVYVNQVTMYPRPDTPSTSPLLWNLQFSDDNSTWTTAATFTSGTWVADTAQVFIVTYRYYRINILTCSAGSYGALSAVQMANSTGGTNLCTTAGDCYASSAQSSFPASNAILTDSAYWGGAGSLPVYWYYDFGSGGATINEVRMTAGSGLTSYFPTTWTFDGSNDASTWINIANVTSGTWVAGTQQIFDFGMSVVPAGSLDVGQSPVEVLATTSNPQFHTEQLYIELIAQNVASVLGCFTAQNPIEIIAATHPPFRTQQSYIELIASTTVLVPNNRLLLTDLIVDTAANYGSPPSVRLRYSDTRGATWDYTQTQTLGAGGDYDTDISFRQLGMSRDRVFEVSWTVPEPMCLTGCFIIVNICKT